MRVDELRAMLQPPSPIKVGWEAKPPSPTKTQSIRAKLKAAQRALREERATRDTKRQQRAAAADAPRADSELKQDMERSMRAARRGAPAPGDAAETVSLFVALPDGTTCALRDLPTSFTADDIRHALERLSARDGGETTHYPAHAVTLVHGSKDFRPGESVAYRGVRDGATLHLLVRALGGEGFDDEAPEEEEDEEPYEDVGEEAAVEEAPDRRRFLDLSDADIDGFERRLATVGDVRDARKKLSPHKFKRRVARRRRRRPTSLSEWALGAEKYACRWPYAKGAVYCLGLFEGYDGDPRGGRGSDVHAGGRKTVARWAPRGDDEHTYASTKRPTVVVDVLDVTDGRGPAVDIGPGAKVAVVEVRDDEQLHDDDDAHFVDDGHDVRDRAGGGGAARAEDVREAHNGASGVPLGLSFRAAKTLRARNGRVFLRVLVTKLPRGYDAADWEVIDDAALDARSRAVQGSDWRGRMWGDVPLRLKVAIRRVPRVLAAVVTTVTCDAGGGAPRTREKKIDDARLELKVATETKALHVVTPAQVFANGTASYVLPSCDAEVALTAAHDLYRDGGSTARHRVGPEHWPPSGPLRVTAVLEPRQTTLSVCVEVARGLPVDFRDAARDRLKRSDAKHLKVSIGSVVVPTKRLKLEEANVEDEPDATVLVGLKHAPPPGATVSWRPRVALPGYAFAGPDVVDVVEGGHAQIVLLFDLLRGGVPVDATLCDGKTEAGERTTYGPRDWLPTEPGAGRDGFFSVKRRLAVRGACADAARLFLHPTELDVDVVDEDGTPLPDADLRVAGESYGGRRGVIPLVIPKAHASPETWPYAAPLDATLEGYMTITKPQISIFPGRRAAATVVLREAAFAVDLSVVSKRAEPCFTLSLVAGADAPAAAIQKILDDAKVDVDAALAAREPSPAAPRKMRVTAAATADAPVPWDWLGEQLCDRRSRRRGPSGRSTSARCGALSCLDELGADATLGCLEAADPEPWAVVAPNRVDAAHDGVAAGGFGAAATYALSKVSCTGVSAIRGHVDARGETSEAMAVAPDLKPGATSKVELEYAPTEILVRVVDEATNKNLERATVALTVGAATYKLGALRGRFGVVVPTGAAELAFSAAATLDGFTVPKHKETTFVVAPGACVPVTLPLRPVDAVDFEFDVSCVDASDWPNDRDLDDVALTVGALGARRGRVHALDLLSPQEAADVLDGAAGATWAVGPARVDAKRASGDVATYALVPRPVGAPSLAPAPGATVRLNVEYQPTEIVVEVRSTKWREGDVHAVDLVVRGTVVRSETTHGHRSRLILGVPLPDGADEEVVVLRADGAAASAAVELGKRTPTVVLDLDAAAAR
ncbi:hypothetical protein JL721_1521 [Aureococcus anophagefferens]|nr:hypothetical protein JL721_1521 [Aureococcus anophagefferens]